jgi:5-enolpyruvylshikimate-3-phosphate synthase
MGRWCGGDQRDLTLGLTPFGEAVVERMVELGMLIDLSHCTPPARLRPAAIDTYDDHRMAMCFALAAVAGLPVHIRDPKCVAKTFPDYFDRLAALTAGAPQPTRDQARS